MNEDESNRRKAENIDTKATKNHSSIEPSKLAQDAVSLGSLQRLDASNVSHLKNSTNTTSSDNTSSKKKSYKNSLNQSNDCLVVDIDDEENTHSVLEINNDDSCVVVNTKKNSKGSKVLFDLKNGVNSSVIVKQPPNSLGNNLRRISSNFSSRITNKQARYEKRKDSSSSNQATPQVLLSLGLVSRDGFVTKTSRELYMMRIINHENYIYENYMIFQIQNF